VTMSPRGLPLIAARIQFPTIPLDSYLWAAWEVRALVRPVRGGTSGSCKRGKTGHHEDTWF
jgi:hypothetical protein